MIHTRWFHCWGGGDRKMSEGDAFPSSQPSPHDLSSIFQSLHFCFVLFFHFMNTSGLFLSCSTYHRRRNHHLLGTVPTSSGESSGSALGLPVSLPSLLAFCSSFPSFCRMLTATSGTTVRDHLFLTSRLSSASWAAVRMTGSCPFPQSQLGGRDVPASHSQDSKELGP